MNRPKKEELASLAEARPASTSPELTPRSEPSEMEPELKLPKPRTVCSSAPRWAWYVATAVISLAILFFAIFGFHLHDHLLRLYILNHGAAGVATVESTRHVRAYRYSDDLLRFSYTVPSGQVYRAEAHVSSNLVGLPRGFLVRIHYLPTRPDLAALDNDGGPLKFALILFPGILLVLSLRFLPLVIRRRKTRRILSLGDVVQGVVERTTRIRSGAYRLFVRFSYNNREWQSKTITEDGKASFAPGDVVTLLVDPADPKSVVAYAVCGYRVIGPDRTGKVEVGRSGMRNGLLAIGFLVVVLVVCFTNRDKLITSLVPGNSATGALLLAVPPPPRTTDISANGLLVGQSAKVHGKYSVPVSPMEELDFKTKQQIYDLRKAHVLEHQELAPKNYAPSEAVFGQITDSRPWWGIYGIFFYGNGQRSIEGPSEQSIFLLNPYLLVGLREPHGFRTQLTPPDEHVIFYPKPLNVEWEAEAGRELITYDVHDHYQHLITHHYYPTSEYRLDLMAYNARDLGFPYMYVDTGKSEGAAPLQQMEKAFPINQYIHCGGSCGYPGGCNNVSPTGQPALTIEINKFPARLQVKLWRNEPKSVNDPCDMTVIIQML